VLYLILFFLELILLYFLSKRLTNKIFQFLYRVIKNRKFAFYVYSVLFLPGTFVHEISHFLAAILLLVPVGKLELLPEIYENEDGAALGSVEIAKTDPLRRFLIGIAPFVLGTTIIIGIIYFFTSNGLLTNYYYLLLIAYICFQIGNSMFASRKDLEGALELFVFFIFLYIVIFALGISFPAFKINLNISGEFLYLFKIADFYLLVPVAIDSLILFLLGVI